MVPFGFRLREYIPWAAAMQPAQPHAWPSWACNISGPEPDNLTWKVWRLFASDNKDQPPPPDCLKNHLILVDLIQMIPLGLCNMSLERIVKPLFSQLY